jgi:hypothetical protein
MKPLQQTVPKEHLVPDGVYRLYYKGVKKEEAVFMHIGQTGLPIFHPLGEPDFQSIFALKGYGETDPETGMTTWVAIFEREGSREDRGY